MLEKKIFKVINIYGHDGDNGHVSWTKCINYPSLSARRLHVNLNEIGLVVFEKRSFENVDRQLTSDLWPRSPNDFDL